MKRALRIMVAAALVASCREQPAPETVAVREDGVLALSLCSFNVRYEGDQDAGWKSWRSRVGRVVGTLRELDADVFGVQEALHGQAADLRASLPDYDFFGVGRDDGVRDGEYAAVFWKKRRFESDPTDRGSFWLSDFPEKAGSRTWGNEVVRIVTWTRLADRATGRSFYVFNTHWDHRSQPFRERAAVLLAARIDARRHTDEPVVLMGDFNATRGNPAVEYLTGGRVTLSGEPMTPWSGAMDDPYETLKGGEENRRTLHFWEADGGRRLNRLKVDHIFVSPGGRALDAGIRREADRRLLPSDHYPVWARVEWG